MRCEVLVWILALASVYLIFNVIITSAQPSYLWTEVLSVSPFKGSESLIRGLLLQYVNRNLFKLITALTTSIWMPNQLWASWRTPQNTNVSFYPGYIKICFPIVLHKHDKQVYISKFFVRILVGMLEFPCAWMCLYFLSNISYSKKRNDNTHLCVSY